MSLLFLWAITAPATGVICLSPLPAPSAYASAGKGASDERYDDSEEARRTRIEAAAKRPPVVYAVGETTSVPVTTTRAACIDGIPLSQMQTLLADGKPFLTFTLSEKEPVRWLTSSPFYATTGLDPLPERLYCKAATRAPTPDCSWCPCLKRRYTPPVKKAQ